MVQLGMGEMGISAHDFWDLTLPEFSLASRGYRVSQQRADYRAGTIAALFGNLHRDEKRRPEPFVAADFFASLPRPRPEEEEEKEATQEEIEAFVNLLQATTSQEKEAPSPNGSHPRHADS